MVLLLTMFRRYGFFKSVWLHLQSLRKSGVTVIHLDGCKQPIYLRNGTSDWPTFHQVFTFQEYHLKLAFDPLFVIDCGANIGLSVAYLKNRYPSARIIAIEPEPSNFEQAKKNTQSLDGVNLVQAAVWNKRMSLQIIKGEDGKHWSFYMKEADSPTSNSIPSVCIGDLLKEFDFPYVDILKVDIEGGEQQLFAENYDNWLPLTKVILLETHDQDRPGTSRSFFQRMGENNFSVTLQGENFVCIREDYLKRT